MNVDQKEFRRLVNIARHEAYNILQKRMAVYGIDNLLRQGWELVLLRGVFDKGARLEKIARKSLAGGDLNGDDIAALTDAALDMANYMFLALAVFKTDRHEGGHDTASSS